MMNPKIAFAWLLVLSLQVAAQNAPIVQVAQGQLQGLLTQDGLREFRGIPFAQPPVGPLRWQEPQPPLPWKGMRKADKFGDRAMQTRVYSDMIFRSDTISEDCLYLNVWAPPVPGQDTLPVLVYFYGGGFMAGDGSEPRYDGASMARRGIVTVTVNYRLGIFGFFAHPELTKASPHQSSGNYGLMDQHAALVWVHNNIKAFGGDPHKVTIAGESAGSNSVSCQVATPLSKGLFRGAIGESGSCLGKNPTATLSHRPAVCSSLRSWISPSLKGHVCQ
jgi:para-nitrobenzyl esterase